MKFKILDSTSIRNIVDLNTSEYLAEETLKDAFFYPNELNELSLREQFFNFRAIAFGKYNDSFKLQSFFYATLGDYSSGLLNVMMRCCYDKENIEEFMRICIQSIQDEYSEEYKGIKIIIPQDNENYKSLVESIGFKEEVVFPKFTISEIPFIFYKFTFK